jgi:hypothetical protein
VNAKDS